MKPRTYRPLSNHCTTEQSFERPSVFVTYSPESLAIRGEGGVVVENGWKEWEENEELMETRGGKVSYGCKGKGKVLKKGEKMEGKRAKRYEGNR